MTSSRNGLIPIVTLQPEYNLGSRAGYEAALISGLWRGQHAAAVELARLQAANEIGRLLHDNFVGVRLERVAIGEREPEKILVEATRFFRIAAAIGVVVQLADHGQRRRGVRSIGVLR